MDGASVDVILPTHRRPHTIAYAIDAVLRQTHRELTLHVVGDGCDDATAAAARASGDPRVRFHPFAKARGYGYANRNRVLRATTAPFIAYASDDDLWLPDHLERGLAELQGRDLDLVAFRSAHVLAPDVLDPHFFAFDWRARPFADFLRRWFLGALTAVHRRAVFERAGYWNEHLVRFGDRDFLVRTSAVVPSAYVNCITVLRFYALHWDARYAGLAAPPQQRYLPCVADPAWCERLRTAAAPGPRGLAVRRRQWADFCRFALRSGPKFVRFWYERFTAHAAGHDKSGQPLSEERGI